MNKELRSQYISIWESCFGDDVEFIEEFLNFAQKKGYIHKSIYNGRVVGFLHLIPASYNTSEGISYKGYYLYSVATDPKERGKGISSTLFAESVKDLDFDFIITVPASESLFSFYYKQGFTHTIYREIIELDREHASSCHNYIYDIKELTATRLETIRSNNENMILWDCDQMRFLVSQAIHNNAILWSWGENKDYYLWAQLINNEIIILESSELSYDKLPIKQLLDKFPYANKVKIITKVGSGGKRERYASILYKKNIAPPKELFINLAMDI
ncbi:MAG: GNAT family N-acetyltransferase [Bacteroidales bacterium]